MKALMKTVKIISVLCVAAAIFCSCAGKPNTDANSSASPKATEPTQGAEQPAPPASSDITVRDMKGRDVKVPAEISRIVVIDAADCEIVYSLGAGDKVVGRGEYCNYPAEAMNVPSVQSGQEANIEQIVALKPQLVIMSTMAQTDEQIAAIEKAGIPVLANEVHDIEGTYSNIEIIGKALGKDEEARKLVADMKAGFDAIKEKVKGQETGKTVYFEVSPLEYGLWAAGSGTFMDEISNMLGLKNVFSDLSGWAQISQEQVIERNPDYIVTVTMYFGDGPLPEEEVASRPGWQGVKAVADGHIYPADNDEITRPGPRLVDAAAMLYSAVYDSDIAIPGAA